MIKKEFKFWYFLIMFCCIILFKHNVYAEDEINEIETTEDMSNFPTEATSAIEEESETETTFIENTTEPSTEHTHTIVENITRASATANGKSQKICITCDKVISETTIYAAKTIKLNKVEYTYNGKAIKPTVIIKDSKGKRISSNNYSVKYSSGCKKIGTYKVNISFDNLYKGSKSLTFVINPKPTGFAKTWNLENGFKVKFKKTSNISGYQLIWSPNKKFNDFYVNGQNYNTKSLTRTIKGCNGISANAKKANRSYYIKVRTYKKVGNKTYYSKWSKVKRVTSKYNWKGKVKWDNKAHLCYEMLDYLNIYRKKNNKDAIEVVWSSDLEKGCLIRAKEMSKTGLSHDRPNGKTTWDLYNQTGGGSIGEVVAEFFGVHYGNIPMQIMEAWFDSPGHKAYLSYTNQGGNQDRVIQPSDSILVQNDGALLWIYRKGDLWPATQGRVYVACAYYKDYWVMCINGCYITGDPVLDQDSDIDVDEYIGSDQYTCD